MVRPPTMREFYDNHPNKTKIKRITFRHRVYKLGYTKEQAMQIPFLGHGGDRKTQDFYIRKKLSIGVGCPTFHSTYPTIENQSEFMTLRDAQSAEETRLEKENEKQQDEKTDIPMQ